jgi:Protein of unknown function (DUF2796)
MKKHFFLAACALLLPTMPYASKAHEHGVVKLDVAVQGQQILITMESPLEGVLGFERAPKSAADNAKVAAATAQLQAADKLFQIDPAAHCRLSKTTLMAPVVGIGVAALTQDKTGHGDLDAEFIFDCQDASQAQRIEVALFDAFANMKRIEVQMATPSGQFKRTLRRGPQPGNSTLLLTRPR